MINQKIRYEWPGLALFLVRGLWTPLYFLYWSTCNVRSSNWDSVWYCHTSPCFDSGKSVPDIFGIGHGSLNCFLIEALPFSSYWWTGYIYKLSYKGLDPQVISKKLESLKCSTALKCQEFSAWLAIGGGLLSGKSGLRGWWVAGFSKEFF